MVAHAESAENTCTSQTGILAENENLDLTSEAQKTTRAHSEELSKASEKDLTLDTTSETQTEILAESENVDLTSEAQKITRAESQDLNDSSKDDRTVNMTSKTTTKQQQSATPTFAGKRQGFRRGNYWIPS